LAVLRNLELESRAANAAQELRQATARATQAAMRYTELGAAEHERQRRLTENLVLIGKMADLQVASPISGFVVTPHVTDLVGRSLDEGDLLFQIADTSRLKAELYIPEFAIHEVKAGAQVKLLVDGSFSPIKGALAQLSPASAPPGTGLVT